MGSAHRQRPFVDDAYEDDDVDGAASARAAIHAPDDRTFIILMYQEHARQARQQEMMRALWAALTLALVVSLALVSTMPNRTEMSGILLCCVAVISAISLAKFRERYVLHLSMMRVFRTFLGETVRPDIFRTSQTIGKAHSRRFRMRGFISLQVVWILGCIAAFGAGATFVWQAVGADLDFMKPRQAAPARQPRLELKPDSPLAPGEGLP